jgi:hypothetical protein
MKSIVTISIVSLLLTIQADVMAFMPSTHRALSTSSKLSSTFSSTSLFAQKKKRRRRKQDSSSSSPSSQNLNNSNDDSIIADDDEDELPDFDLIEDIDLPQPITTGAGSTTVQKTTAPAAKKKSLDLNDPAVLEAMKATSFPSDMSSSGNTKELLRNRNRELEQKLVVDEIVQDVPSFADYNAKKGRVPSSSGGSSSPVMGKKAMRKEKAIAAAAMEAANAETEDNAVSQLLSKLPFVGNKDDEEKEKKSALKLLEEGTWACIYILVAWEIYINTPLFQRAAPMAPVVFQDPVTMTFLM